jgi:hypothetical protein
MAPAENLNYGSLIAIRRGHGTAVPHGSIARPSAKICVVAFSVAIPLLAALVLVNRQEALRRRVTRSVLVAIAQVVAQAYAIVGVVAGFWHIEWIARWGCWRAGSWGWRFTPQAICARHRNRRPRKFSSMVRRSLKPHRAVRHELCDVERRYVHLVRTTGGRTGRQGVPSDLLAPSSMEASGPGAGVKHQPRPKGSAETDV